MHRTKPFLFVLAPLLWACDFDFGTRSAPADQTALVEEYAPGCQASTKECVQRALDRKAEIDDSLRAIREGGVYAGPLANGKRNGKGVFTWFDGKRYVGEFKDDAIQGKGTLYWVGDTTYTGDFAQGKMTGSGTLTWAKDSQYVGQVVDGVPDGKGRMAWPIGDVYDGAWKAGKRNGYGEFTYFDGRKYLGNWVDGERQGQGKYYWTPDWYYDGQWAGDVISGKGTVVRPHQANLWYKYEGGFTNWEQNGSGTLWFDNGHYTGGFSNGDYDGYGTWYNSGGGSLSGTFVQGAWPTKVTEIYADGSRYVGEVVWASTTFEGGGSVTDEREGHGILYFKSGRKQYEGGWKGDEPYGSGTQYWESGDSFAAVFTDWRNTAPGWYWDGSQYFCYQLVAGQWRNATGCK